MTCVRFSTLTAVLLLAGGAAQAEILVIVNPKHTAATMTAEQVSNIYAGKDATLAPIDLPEAAPSRAEFYAKVLGKDAAQVKSMWARLIFTGRSQPPRRAESAAAAVKLVAANENSIAYVEKSAVDASVKSVLTIK